jgi:Leucine-rich repeat (LRR) protein
MGTHSQTKNGLLLTAMEAPYDKPELFETETIPNLTRLKLSDSYKWEDRHLAHITKLKSLESLYLSNSAITDESIKHINALPKLTTLEASGVHLSKSSIAQLKRLPNLIFLSLSNVPNLSGAFTSMAHSKAPYYLILCNCNLSDADVKVFSTLSSLHQLELKDNPRVTNDGFLSLARLKHLAVLKVSGTAITPEVIPKLKNFTALEELIVDIGSWSDADRKRAQKISPKHAKVDYSQEQKDRRDDIN